MTMGREGDRQGDLIVTWAEMPRSPGHVFYDRLQEVLLAGGFDLFVLRHAFLSSMRSGAPPGHARG
jgi:hypothetical protein